jgi:hypothetical protein
MLIERVIGCDLYATVSDSLAWVVRNLFTFEIAFAI